MRTGAAADAAPGSRPGVDDLRHDSLDEAGPLQGSKYEDMQAAHTLLQVSEQRVWVSPQLRADAGLWLGKAAWCG